MSSNKTEQRHIEWKAWKVTGYPRHKLQEIRVSMQRLSFPFYVDEKPRVVSKNNGRSQQVEVADKPDVYILMDDNRSPQGWLPPLSPAVQEFREIDAAELPPALASLLARLRELDIEAKKSERASDAQVEQWKLDLAARREELRKLADDVQSKPEDIAERTWKLKRVCEVIEERLRAATATLWLTRLEALEVQDADLRAQEVELRAAIKAAEKDTWGQLGKILDPAFLSGALDREGAQPVWLAQHGKKAAALQKELAAVLRDKSNVEYAMRHAQPHKRAAVEKRHRARTARREELLAQLQHT